MNTIFGRALTRISAPATEPVLLAEAKLYLRVDHAQDDTLIADLIATTRSMAEQYLGQSLITQTWKLAYDGGAFLSEDRYGNLCVPLPMGPVVAVSNVSIVSRDGETQEIDTNHYTLSAAKHMLLLASGVTGFRVEITYTAGFGDASAVPRPIKQGMLAHIASLFDCRGDDTQHGIPAQAMQLYAPFREVRL